MDFLAEIANSSENETFELQGQNLGMWKLGYSDHCGYKDGPGVEPSATGGNWHFCLTVESCWSWVFCSCPMALGIICIQ